MAKTFTVSYPDEVYQAIQDQAESEGVKPSDVVREAIHIYLKLDPVLMQSARRLAAGFGVETIDVLQNMAIRGFAQNQAHIEVYGTPLPDIAQNLFAWESDQTTRHLITGDQLYQNLKQNFVREYEQARLKEVNNLLQHIGKREFLSKEDQDFLQRMDQKRSSEDNSSGYGGWSGDNE